MFIQTWLLPFMLLLVATVVAFPLSSTWRGSWTENTGPGGFRLVREAPRQRAPELEAVHGLPARLQHRALRLRLHRPVAPAVDAPEPARHEHARPDDHPPQRHLLHDEHGPPALLGGPAPVELQPDLLGHHQPLPLGGGRASRPRARSSGPSAAIPTWAISSSTCGARSSTCSCPSPSFSPSSSWSRAAR